MLPFVGSVRFLELKWPSLVEDNFQNNSGNMQYCFAALIFLGLSTTIAAQIPDCAKDCIDRATIKQGCTVGDLVCSCTTKNFDAIEADSGTCVVTACGSDKAQSRF